MAEGNKAKTLAAPLVALLAADVDFHDELDRVFPVYPNATADFADERGPAPRRSTPRCRPATSSSASAPPGWPPGRWAASTPTA